jgi:hypothetical protein
MSPAERRIIDELMAKNPQSHVTDNDMRDFVVRLADAHGLDHLTMQKFQEFRKTAVVGHHAREAFIAGIRSGVGFGTISYTAALFQQQFIDLMEAHPEWDDATREKYAVSFAYIGPALGFLVTGNLAFTVVSSWINKHGLGSFTHANELAHLKTHSGKGGKEELKAQATLQLKESQWRFFEIIHTAGAFLQHERFMGKPFVYATQRGLIQSPLAGISASLWKSWTGFRVKDDSRLVNMSDRQLGHVVSQSRLHHSDHQLLGMRTGPTRAFANELAVWAADLGKAAVDAIHPTQWPAWRTALSKGGAVGMLTFAAGLAVAVPLYGRSNHLTNLAVLQGAAGNALAAEATAQAAYKWHQVANGFTLAEVFIYRGWVQNWLSRSFGLTRGTPPGRTAEQAAHSLQSPYLEAATNALQTSEGNDNGLADETIASAQTLVEAMTRTAPASSESRLTNVERLLGRLTAHRNAIQTGLANEPQDVDQLYSEMSGLISNAREIVAEAGKSPAAETERETLNTAVDRLEQSFNFYAEFQATQMTPQNLASLAASLSGAETPEKNILASILAAGFNVVPLTRQEVRAIMTPILEADPASFGPAADAVDRIKHETLKYAHLHGLSLDIAGLSDNHVAKQRLLQLVSDRTSPNGPADLPIRAQLFDSSERFWLVRPWLEHAQNLDNGTQDTLVGMVNALQGDRTFRASDKADMNGYVEDLSEDLKAKFTRVIDIG